MTETALMLNDVTKRFGTHNVLNGVSLKVPRGETVAFLGRNGAGKTTTLRMLIGLLQPDDGSISVMGLDPGSKAIEIRRRTGYLAEDQQMFGWMTVEELIRFMAPFYPSWDHGLAIGYVQQFELPAHARVRQLSKGQTMRLGLLLALAHRPELVLLDDPVLGLDPVMRRKFNRDLITHLQAEGRTVFYSSHLLYEVEPIADRVAILHGGSIVKYERTEVLRADVKRLVIPVVDTSLPVRHSHILDVECRSGEMAVVVSPADRAIADLRESGYEPRIQDLSLDEIFEAYVVGSEGNTGEAQRADLSEQLPEALA